MAVIKYHFGCEIHFCIIIKVQLLHIEYGMMPVVLLLICIIQDVPEMKQMYYNVVLTLQT